MRAAPAAVSCLRDVNGSSAAPGKAGRAPGGGQEEVAIIGRSEEREWSDIERRSRELAGRFLAGDRRSFDRLILLHQSMVYSLCLRLLGDPDEADDAAQEVFIRVYRYIGGFGFRSSLRTLLYRIAVHT